MTLKAQLTLIAALALLLPWFAYSYLQYLDKQFQVGQQALLANDIQRLNDQYFTDEQWQRELKRRSRLVGSVGAEPLARGAQVDGFVHDWPAAGKLTSFAELSGNGKVALRLGESADKDFWLLLSIDHLPFTWAAPQGLGFDEVKIDVGAVSWRLRATAEGAGQVEVLSPSGQWRSSFNSAAVIRSKQNGVLIEWQLPKQVIEAPVQLSYFNHQLGYSLFARKDNAPFYPVRLTRELVFSEYLPGAMRVRWFDANGWLFAAKGEFNDAAQLPDINDQASWLRRLYLLWFRSSYPALPASSAHIDAADACIANQWFSYQLAAVNRQCLQVGGLGTLIVDYRDETQFAAQAKALVYFLALSALFALVLLVAVLGFGSLHSWRIRRLARLITSLRQGQGRAERLARRSWFNDEIDQLRGQFGDYYHFAEEQKAYLSALAPKLSHELKTPLAIISSSLDNLLHTADDNAIVYAERAQAGSRRLSSILHAMTAAQTFEQTLEQAEREDVPLQDFFESVHAGYQQVYPDKTIALKLNVGAAHWLLAPDLIAQMLDKLVANACDFAVDGSTVEIAAVLRQVSVSRSWSPWRRQQYRAELALSVTNIGEPIAEHIKGSLFDSLVSARQAGQSGSSLHLGLGLYIARLICEWHGGTIAAASELLGDGLAKTSFTATLQDEPIVLR